jgi:TRAP-type C4-dicarboxylate transport system substrate-binding protein
VPTTVPAPETYTAVERGVVQAASWPFSYAHAAYRLHEISNWFTINMAVGTVFCPIVNHADSYAALPDEYKKLLDEAKWLAQDVLKAAYAEADEKNVPMFRDRMTEVRYTDEELERFREVAGQPVWDAWAQEAEDKGLPGREALEFVVESAKRAAAKGS